LWEALQSRIFSQGEISLSRWMVIPTTTGSHCSGKDFTSVPRYQGLVGCECDCGVVMEWVGVEWIRKMDRREGGLN
jgi:hypothetical protein